MKIYVKSSKYKRIARTEEFDNGRVLHNDWLEISDEEAEQIAQKKSEEDPGSIYYVQYDDIMNPSSDIYWYNGASYGNYNEAQTAYRQKLREFIDNYDNDN